MSPIDAALWGGAGGKLLTLPNIAIGLAAGLVLYSVGLAVYRIWFHPLSKYPGPLDFAISDFSYNFQSSVTGNLVRRVHQLHKKHGKVVRIGPNRLSFDGSVAFPEVFAHRPGGDATEFHKVPGFFFPGDHNSLIGAPNREEHRRQRRHLAHAFSDGALTAQEPVLQHYVDLFIRRLAENAEGGSKPVPMMDWLNYITFDIIGDLALGESFGSLKSSDYHPWVHNLFKGLRGGALARFWVSLGPLAVFALLDPGGSLKANENNFTYGREKARARIALGADAPHNTEARAAGASQLTGSRPDFFAYMMKNMDSGKGMSNEEMQLNAVTLIAAGSETTGTTLAVLIFVLSQPRYRAFRDAVMAEVRSTFSAEADVTLRAAKNLPLLHACIEEALRFHPPVGDIPPRESPGGVVNGQFVPKGTIVHCSAYNTFHNPENFVDPDEFLPQRFLPADHPMHDPRLEVGDSRALFKPFSHGPRDCIGKNLAYAEMHLVAARVFLRFDIELGESTSTDWLDRQPNFLIWEKTQLWLKMTERKDLKLKE
ncbi:hypothetical protein RB595_003606 [Gaeumannomyces hyphopodioides]